LTIITPNYQQAQSQANGFDYQHVIAAHEPTREGEQPQVSGPTPAAKAPEAAAAAMPPLKVALIGTAPSSRMLAPYNDPSWQIWGCSPGNMNALPRVNLWFELHSNLLWPQHESYGRPYIEWLKVQSFPVYMQDQTLVPRATIFPRDELVERFGDEFFTSSFAWMMALAIRMGATEIALYGIDMASRDEYIRQRPGFYYFKREAIKLGIKVSAPNESDIMQSPPLYAYVDSTPFGRKIMARREEVSGRINGMSQQIEQANRSKTYLEGALEDLDYFESIWSGVSNDLGRLTYENAKLKREIAQMHGIMNQLPSVQMPPPNRPEPIRRRRRGRPFKVQPVVTSEAPPQPDDPVPVL
jgi:hypothetical protein